MDRSTVVAVAFWSMRNNRSKGINACPAAVIAIRWLTLNQSRTEDFVVDDVELPLSASNSRFGSPSVRLSRWAAAWMEERRALSSCVATKSFGV